MDSVLGAPTLSAGFAAAFAVGVGGSLHCLAMCGPLACAAIGSAGSDKLGAALGYQLGRLIAYAAVGGLIGTLGGTATRFVSTDLGPYLPWVLAAGLLFTALDLGKRLPRIKALERLAAGISRLGAKVSPRALPVAIGAATPLLPCGLLYGLFAAALATGSAFGGAGLLAAFALGSLPALVVAQAQTKLWSTESRAATLILRRVIPLVAVAMLVVRAATADAPRCH